MFVEEERYSEQEQKLESLKLQPSDYELSLELSTLTNSTYVVSQCFSSETTTWRVILDLDHDGEVSIYLQERGSLKSNQPYLRFDSDVPIPEYASLDFISVIVRMESIFVI